MKYRTILDLCSGSGAWSQPYVDAGYTVIRVDLPDDVRLVEYPDKVHGILAAPPCTMFASSGARWPRTKDEIRDALSVVDACFRIVTICRPEWWVLENPVGTLRRWIGPPRCYFNPSDYGDTYTKKTGLWGNFTQPFFSPVIPSEGSKMHTNYGGGRGAARSVTPAGFAKAFFEANP